jgi:hypothetical protein
MLRQTITLSLTIFGLIFADPIISLATENISQEQLIFNELEGHLPKKPVSPPLIFIAIKSSDIANYNKYINIGNDAINKGLKTGNIYHYHTALINYDQGLQLKPEQIKLKKAINDLELYLYDYHMRQGYKLVKEAQKTRNYYYYQLALDNFTRATYRKAGNKYANIAISNVKKYSQPEYLNEDLKQAICAENWQQALNIIQSMKDIGGQNYSYQLNEYRTKFLYMLRHNSETPTYPPESYCQEPTIDKKPAK